MITETLKSVEIQPQTEQCSPALLVESDITATLEANTITDRSVALIIDNSGKILLVQSIRPNTGESIWGIPMNDILEAESPAEAAVRGLKENAGFSVLPNHLLPLGVITSGVENLNNKIHLFLHKTSQVRYAAPYESIVTDSRPVRWIHKYRVAESIRTRDLTDFGTVSLFEKAVLLGII